MFLFFFYKDGRVRSKKIKECEWQNGTKVFVKEFLMNKVLF